MTADDAREHANAWNAAADRLDKIAADQTVTIDGKRIAPSAACAVADLARAVAKSYAEIAEKPAR